MPSTQHAHRPHSPIVTLTRSIQKNQRVTASDTPDANTLDTNDQADTHPPPLRHANQFVNSNTRPGTYQFRESIHRRRVMLRTFHFSLPPILSSLFILSYLTSLCPHSIHTPFPHHFHTCTFLLLSSLLPYFIHDSYMSRLLYIRVDYSLYSLVYSLLP